MHFSAQHRFLSFVFTVRKTFIETVSMSFIVSLGRFEVYLSICPYKHCFSCNKCYQSVLNGALCYLLETVTSQETVLSSAFALQNFVCHNKWIYWSKQNIFVFCSSLCAGALLQILISVIVWHTHKHISPLSGGGPLGSSMKGSNSSILPSSLLELDLGPALRPRWDTLLGRTAADVTAGLGFSWVSWSPIADTDDDVHRWF